MLIIIVAPTGCKRIALNSIEYLSVIIWTASEFMILEILRRF